MRKETIIENEFVTMWYYRDKKILHHQIHNYLIGDDLKNMLNTGIKKLKETGACKWLSDDRSYAPLPKEDIEWGREVWTPKALAAGFRHWAIVMPESVTGKMSHRRMVQEYADIGLNVNVFSDVDEAMEWLEAQ